MTPYWKGATIGFLIGSLGMFVLAGLALIIPFFEIIGNVIFAPLRAIAPDNSTLPGIVLFILSGILYAVVGVLIQYVYRKLTRSP